MSSVSSVSSSSIYGSRSVNILSGLASGLDTESMIQGMVESYEMKISNLESDRTFVQWEQEAIQTITNMLIEFDNKYNSYTSSTNLASASFFQNASITETLGEFADKISASGDTDSDVILNAVAQLATKTTYRTSADNLLSAGGTTITSSGATITGEVPENSFDGTVTVSDLEGELEIKYGSKTISVNFGELEFLDADENGTGVVTAQALADAINEKLADEDIVFSDGTSHNAGDVIGVSVEGGAIKFADKIGGNGVGIESASGKIATTLGLEDLDSVVDSIAFTEGTHSSEIATMEHLSGQQVNFSFNGKTSSVTIDSTWTADNFTDKINDALADAYGSGKVSVSKNAAGALEFSVQAGSSFEVSSNVGETLGFGKDGKMSTSVNLEMTLKDLGYTGEQTFTINGVSVGTFDEDSTLNDILQNINANDEIGVTASYSTTSNQFVFSSDETGTGREIEFGGTLGNALFGDPESASGTSTYTKGQDAIVSATVNGETVTLVRSDNTFEIDGMRITLNDTFNKGTYEGVITNGMAEDGTVLTSADMFGAGEAVSFKTTADSEKIIETISGMVDDYNEIMEYVKKTYSDTPLTTSSGEKYEPLSDADKADLTESEIEAYEEKAKTGILFMDSEISALYSDLREVMEGLGATSGALKDIGITVNYQDGLSSLSLDANQMRIALEEDPDKVEEAFTNVKEYGSSFDGIMQGLSDVVNTYAKPTGEPKGLLITRAGSQYSPTSAINNRMLTEMNEIDEEIEKWADKLANQVDYYTAQFTNLEILINEMNAQSSSFASMMGG